MRNVERGSNNKANIEVPDILTQPFLTIERLPEAGFEAAKAGFKNLIRAVTKK